MVLPQTTTMARRRHGKRDFRRIRLLLRRHRCSSAGNGQSLVIAGYGVNAATYQCGGAAVYGNAALAQSTSLEGQAVYTAVSRASSQISAITARSIPARRCTTSSTPTTRAVSPPSTAPTFYISGQGVKGDTTQGVFVAQDGASTPPRSTHQRYPRRRDLQRRALCLAEQLAKGTAEHRELRHLPTRSATPTILPGINQSSR